MEKTTKNSLMEHALSQHDPEKIERAIECTFHAIKKDGGKIICTFSLASRSLTPRIDKIRQEINSTLTTNPHDTHYDETL